MNRTAPIAFALIFFGMQGAFATEQLWLPTGQTVTPLAAPGARFDPLALDLPTVGHAIAGQGVTTAVTADGATLFVLTSGYNLFRGATGSRILEASTEHLFVYDISGGMPVFRKAISIPNAFGGLAFSPDGSELFVGGGADDSIIQIKRSGQDWLPIGTTQKLNHGAGNALVRIGAVLKPAAAGLAITADSTRVVLANYQNDSVTIAKTDANGAALDVDLRPGKVDPNQRGIAGGEFPNFVAIKGNETAYVSSVRDREIVMVSLGEKPAVTGRIKLKGNPTRILLNRDQSKLFVAEDNSDRVSIIDTVTNRVVTSIPTMTSDGFGPAGIRRPGASPNGLALSPDEKTLYVTDGGINAVSVLSLDGQPHLLGLIPTAWQPNSVSVSADGKMLYIANGKSPAGPNPRNCMKVTTSTTACPKDSQERNANQYVFALTTGGLQTIPVPSADLLAQLSHQVAANNSFGPVDTVDDARIMAFLRAHIKHVIYIVRENRTFDQILGDLPGVNGDPNLVQFDSTMTPNAHALATNFVALDAFFDSGEVSGDGWGWSTSARTTDATEKQVPVNYADRGMINDNEGTSRGINVALPTSERSKANPVGRDSDDLLPGPANETAPDGPNGEFQQGYLWNAALRAKVSVRNYGFFLDIVRYFPEVPSGDRIPLEREPAKVGLRVAYPASPDLQGRTDLHFRGFDNSFPDYWRYHEWAREFDMFAKNGKLPQFETVRFMHDHTGDFGTAIDGVNTPETQIADNDYAVGLLIEKIAHSRYAKDTLVFVIEDDAQDGPDHVDAHRSVAFVAGPYVKQHAVVSERFTTVSMIRTIEEVFGLQPLNVHDAHTRPMAGVFDTNLSAWTYQALVPSMLRSTKLPLPVQSAGEHVVHPLHDAPYWAEKTKGYDFRAEDRLDSASYNRMLWDGMKPDRPYPTARSGARVAQYNGKS